MTHGEGNNLKPYFQERGITIYHGHWESIRWPYPGTIDKVGLLLTDPPYGSGLAVDFADRFKTKAGKWWNKDDRSGRSRHVPVVGDDKPFEPAPLLLIPAAAKVLWGGNWYASRLPDRGGWWIWDKRNGKRDVSEADWPMSEAELAWTTIGKGTRIFRHTWFGLIRDSDHGEHYHPTQKPVALMRWCIELSKTEGVVLDPYMGSGTTLVAAKQLGRPAIGIECEEKYCEIAVRRLEQMGRAST